MPAPPEPTPEELERLRSTLWHSMARHLDSQTAAMSTNVTSQLVASMTEVVFKQIQDVAKDVEGFARHAGRGTVSTKDVLLLARRNESLEDVMKDWVKDREAGKK